MPHVPVLLLTKNDHWSLQAGNLAQCFFGDSLIWEMGKITDPQPKTFSELKEAVVISFLSPWIIPQSLLDKAELAINFHPGSCDYPGTGCYNFALYEAADYFGPVCHHMLSKVDTGAVIDERLFELNPDETVETLKLRTMIAMLAQFHDICALIAQGRKLPTYVRQWQREAFTRKELNALCEITPEMSDDEKNRRILATTYPGYPGPYLLKDGKKEYYPVPNRAAIA